MKKASIIACFLLFFPPAPACADLPDFILDRDYRNCLGDDKDPVRLAYCTCIRNGMKNWDESTYIEAAMQTAASASDPQAQPAGRLADLAKQCFSQVSR